MQKLYSTLLSRRAQPQVAAGPLLHHRLQWPHCCTLLLRLRIGRRFLGGGAACIAVGAQQAQQVVGGRAHAQLLDRVRLVGGGQRRRRRRAWIGGGGVACQRL